MNKSKKIPIVAFVGRSNSGKTTLLKKLILCLVNRGYRVGAIKHTHHTLELDKRGKDSYEMKNAGAATVCIFSPTQLGLVSDLTKKPSLETVVKTFFSDVDLVLAEGFKQYNVPHILVMGAEKSLLKVSQSIAIVSEKKVTQAKLKTFRPDQVEAIVDFLEKRFLL